MAKQIGIFLVLLVGLIIVPAPLLGQNNVLLDDFENVYSAEYWGLWIPDNSIQAECVIDQPGYESDHSLRLTFALGSDEMMVCGWDEFENVGDRANSSGLSFFWRADRASANIVVEVSIVDPTQEDPNADGHSTFRAPVLKIPADTDDKAARWAHALIPWSAFTKVEWETSGTHTLNLVDLDWLGFIIDQPQEGNIWIDNFALTYEPLTPAAAPATDLATVNDFLIQWGNVDLEAIGETAYDLIVIEHGFFAHDNPTTVTPEKIAALQHSPGGEKIVLAVLPNSYAETYRYYWRGDWEPGNPEWLDSQYPNSESWYHVHYWDPGWQAILYGSRDSYLDRILAMGFDGIYISTSTNYWYYYNEMGRETAIDEMMDLIVDLANYAHERNPDFLIVVEEPPPYSEDRPDYIAAIDGVVQGVFYYGQDGPNTPDSFGTIGTVEPILDQWLEAGKIILIWAITTDPDQIADQYTRARERGYIPFASGEPMDTITINPGFEPD